MLLPTCKDASVTTTFADAAAAVQQGLLGQLDNLDLPFEHISEHLPTPTERTLKRRHVEDGRVCAWGVRVGACVCLFGGQGYVGAK